MQDSLIHLGYILTLTGFLIRDMLWLRLALTAGQALVMVYSILQSQAAMAIWNSLFTGINAVQAFFVYRERRPIEIPEALKDIYASTFKPFSTREFLFFWELGTPRATQTAILVKEGSPPKSLSLVLRGTVRVVKNGAIIAHLSRGRFIAEMSFLTGEPATATIEAEGQVTLISWDQEKLRSLSKLNPNLFIKVHSLFGREMAEKIKESHRR